MTRIVAGLFEDQPAADRAIERLHDLGAGERDVTTFIVSPPGMHHELPLGGDEAVDSEAKGGHGGALRGAALGGAAGIAAGLVAAPLVGPAGIAAGIGAGAYVGALAGAASSMGESDKQEPTARPGGVMVAANAEGTDPQPIIEAMRANGAKLVELDDGEWRDGKWVDFDPVKTGEFVVAKGNPNYPT
jgi:hypothetical protein